jgi:hypothetical protein
LFQFENWQIRRVLRESERLVFEDGQKAGEWPELGGA